MNKFTSNQLLNLATSLENKALVLNNDRAWMLASFADINNLQLFMGDLDGFLDLDLNLEDITKWLEKNSSFFGLDLVSKAWYIELDENTMPFLGTGAGSQNHGALLSYRIYKSPLKPSDNYKIKESYLSQATDKIPVLYMYKVVSFPIASPVSSLGRQLSYYSFIVTALHFLIDPNSKIDEAFVKESEEFIQHNKNKIDKILNIATMFPKLLGKGSNGIVFDIGNNFVIKLFTDQSTYNTTVAAIKRLHNTPLLAKTEAMIYDVGYLGKFQNVNIFYYIQEKMTPIANLGKEDNNSIAKSLKSIISKIIFSIRDDIQFWRNLKEKINDPKHVAIIKQQLDARVEDIEKKIKESFDEENSPISSLEKETHHKLHKNWLNSLIEEVIMKYLTSRTDLHLGNLGLTQTGYFRYFDPAFGHIKSNINFPGIPVMEF